MILLQEADNSSQAIDLEGLESVLFIYEIPDRV
jgi:hypothetical protein